MTIGLARRPADSLFALRRLNSMLDDAFANWPALGENGSVTSAWVPAVDITENKEVVRITTELPGVRPEDVKLSVENSILSIRGEKRSTHEEKTDRMHRYERQYGSFERTFSLPSTVDVERIEARYDNGVLTVELPKVEKAKPKQIEIKAQA
ncbi:MAG TPA: Hsp20/alpha crystallin family protein [Gemmatimonadales bacterium]|nr:Hsp20/alpha crystallin family protein [Gemmatimonadales bacterium]